MAAPDVVFLIALLAWTLGVSSSTSAWRNPYTDRVHGGTSLFSRHQSDAPFLSDPAAGDDGSEPETLVADWLFEGDIIMSDPDNPISAEESRYAYAAVTDTQRHWPNGVVHYKFHNNLSSSLRRIVRDVMNEFQRKTCVRFVERTNQAKYVLVKHPGQRRSCSSNVGVVAGKRNLLNLHDACFRKRGKIIHELMHTLGFYHEQSRADRDTFVEIKWNNVVQNAATRHNFRAYGSAKVDHLGEEYDYASVMHYPANAFAVSNELRTIVPLKQLPAGLKRIGQRKGFSDRDLVKIRKLYKCGVQCSSSEWKCADGKQCIPTASKCNKRADCNDRSDESSGVCPAPSCTKEQFNCGAKCIPKSWLCDTMADCPDGRDEVKSNCQRTCDAAKQFTCTSAHKCIPKWRINNGRRDCPGGEDERVQVPRPPEVYVPPTTTTQRTPFRPPAHHWRVDWFGRRYYTDAWGRKIYEQTTTPRPHVRPTSSRHRPQSGGWRTQQPSTRPVYRQPSGGCSNPDYYRRYQQYCYYNYRGRRQKNLCPYGFCDGLEDGLNVACNVPASTIGNPALKLDTKSLIEKKYCHFLVVGHAHIFANADSKADEAERGDHVDWLSLPASADRFLERVNSEIADDVKRAGESAKPIVATTDNAEEEFGDPLGDGDDEGDAASDDYRKMEIYLSFGGPGSENTFLDLVRRGPTAMQSFANSTRRFARQRHADGVVFDFRGSGSAVADVLSLMKELEEAFRLDPAKGPSSPDTIDLLLAVVLTESFLNTAQQESVEEIFRVADFVMAVPDGLGTPAEYRRIEPPNHFLKRVLDGTTLARLGNNETRKALLTLRLGGKAYRTLAENAALGDNALGASFLGIDSPKAGQITYGEVCQSIPNTFIELIEDTYMSAAPDDDTGKLVRSTERIFRGAKELVVAEVGCTLAQKLERFDAEKMYLGSELGYDARNKFAGLYIDDVTLDDLSNRCETFIDFTLLSTVHKIGKYSELNEEAVGGVCSQNAQDFEGDDYPDY